MPQNEVRTFIHKEDSFSAVRNEMRGNEEATMFREHTVPSMKASIWLHLR